MAFGDRTQQKDETTDQWLARLKELHGSKEQVEGREAQNVAERSLINSSLFGIPDAIAKAADSDNFKNYQALKEKYNKQAMAGDLAGAFVPTGGVLFNAAGKGLKAAGTLFKSANLLKAGEALGKAGSFVNKGSIINKAGKAQPTMTGLARGALTSAEQLAPRVLSGQTNLKDAMAELGLSAGLGGVVGLATKGISKIANPLKEKAGVYADELGKIRNQFLEGAAGIDGRATRTILKEYAGQGAKGLGKFAVAEDALDQTARIIDENKLYNIGGDDKYFAKVSKHWQDMNDAAAAKFGKDVPGKALFDAALEKGSGELAEITGAEGVKVNDALAKIAKEGGEYEGIHGFKKYLDDAYKDTFNDTLYPKSSDKQAARDAVGLVRRNLDDIVADAAEEFGLDPAIIAERKRNYIFDRALGESFAKQVMKGKSFTPGSQTAMRSAVRGAVGGGLGYASGQEDEEKLKRMGAGLAIGAGSDIIGGLLSKGVNKLATKAVAKSGGLIDAIRGIPDSTIIPDMANKAVQAGERFISSQTSKPEGVEPEVSQAVESEAVTPEVTKAETPVNPINDKLQAKIDNRLMQIYAQGYADQVSWEDFRNYASELTGGFDPVKSANVLYENPKEREKFIRDYKVSQKLKNFAVDSKESGFFDNKETKAQKEFNRKELSDAIGSLLVDAGNLPSEKDMKQIALDLKLIGALKVSDEKKNDILLQKLSDTYGMGVEQLRELGLV